MTDLFLKELMKSFQDGLKVQKSENLVRTTRFLRPSGVRLTAEVARYTLD